MEIVAMAYTKEMQTQSNRIKPKKESTFGKVRKVFTKTCVIKKKPIREQDKQYLQWLQEQEYNCFSCGKQNGIEWHHVKRDSTDKKDHTSLIPLCGVDCHRLGDKLSAHGTPKLFREVYPIELQREYAKNIYLKYLKNKI